MPEPNEGLPLWAQILSMLVGATGVFKFIYDMTIGRKKSDAEAIQITDTSNMNVVKVSDALLREWMTDANKAIREVNKAERIINNFKIVLADGLEIIKECRPENSEEFIERAENLLNYDHTSSAPRSN